jgi:hypothetical protein
MKQCQRWIKPKKTNEPSEKSWDWAWIYYLGRNILRLSEEEFWASTPRKIIALFNVYKKVRGIETAEEEQEVFIDQIPFL